MCLLNFADCYHLEKRLHILERVVHFTKVNILSLWASHGTWHSTDTRWSTVSKGLEHSQTPVSLWLRKTGWVVSPTSNGVNKWRASRVGTGWYFCEFAQLLAQCTCVNFWGQPSTCTGVSYFLKLLVTDSYLEYAKVDHQMLFFNPKLWHYCSKMKYEACCNAKFLGQFCRLFPFQAMKTVRLRLNLTRSLLSE